MKLRNRFLILKFILSHLRHFPGFQDNYIHFFISMLKVIYHGNVYKVILFIKIITSVKIISKLIFKLIQKRAHDIWRAVRSHPTHPPDTPLSPYETVFPRLHYQLLEHHQFLRITL